MMRNSGSGTETSSLRPAFGDSRGSLCRTKCHSSRASCIALWRRSESAENPVSIENNMVSTNLLKGKSMKIYRKLWNCPWIYGGFLYEFPQADLLKVFFFKRSLKTNSMMGKLTRWMNVLDVGIRPAIPLVDGCIHMAASHDSKFTGAKHINTIPVIFYHMLNQKMEYFIRPYIHHQSSSYRIIHHYSWSMC